MRFLFTTLQFQESDFYGRVTERLGERGHEAVHVTFSRRAAEDLRARGFVTWCLPEVMAGLPAFDVAEEVARIEALYDTPSLRDIYKTDWPCYERSEAWCLERTVRHFLALERIYDEAAPDVVVPEVGSETIRTATHLIGLQRGIPVLFLFYTLFPEPLRLYRDTMHAPIVTDEDIVALGPAEREKIEAFIAEFTVRRTPIRRYRRSRITPQTLRDFARHLRVNRAEPDNEYLVPSTFVSGYVRQRARELSAKRLYTKRSGRPYAYFPLHVTDDYKIKRVIPHCVDQAAIIEQVADQLPQGYDLILKEHPMSLGRNSLAMLRRLARIPNVRLVEPYTSSHDLMRDAEAVIVISSTVGLEALMYDKPVLTLGQPFYANAGVTLDLDSFAGIREAVPQVVREWRPDHERILQFLHAAWAKCYAGTPVLVDRSDANAVLVAASLDDAAREHVREPVAG